MTVESNHAIALVLVLVLVGILSQPLVNGIHAVVYWFSQTSGEQKKNPSRHLL